MTKNVDDQFSDAPHDHTLIIDSTFPPDVKEISTGIEHEDELVSPSEESDDTFLDSDYGSSDEREWIAQNGEQSVNDEDWEMAEKDFTKQYNRLRQHNAISQGQAYTSGTAPVVLPAINRPKPTRTSNANTTSTKDAAERKAALDKRLTDQLTRLSKYASRIANLDAPYTKSLSATDNTTDANQNQNQNQGSFQLGVSVNRKGPSASANQKDRADRATTEQVLDARTRIILYKMIGREVVKEINGCVSTGKEANVYHALTPSNAHLALKIYKTSILIFKDRDKYVTGEFRFRRGYSRHNPRKMVRLWAEKEMRNLKRLHAAGIQCPEAIEVRENVLVMKFLGDEGGWASPRLKDAAIPSEKYTSLYLSLMCTVRKMYHECKLIHADLSEYNILYHADSLWIIDVSQSVEHEHPSALDFLRKDLKNVTSFFEGVGVECLRLRKAYEFVTKESLEGEDGEEVLRGWIETQRSDGKAEEETDEVFFNKFIPRSLNEVLDPEKEIAKASVERKQQQKEEEKLSVRSPTRVRFTGIPEGKDETDSEEEGSLDDEEEEESGDEATTDRVDGRKSRGHRHEDRQAKKERKKAVKEEQREKRKTKMPKAEKKKRIKNTSR